MTPKLGGWMRLRLTDGTWLAGLWAKQDKNAATRLPDSYASGYPESHELFLLDSAEIDADGLLTVDEDNVPVRLGRALPVRWDQIAYAEFIEG